MRSSPEIPQFRRLVQIKVSWSFRLRRLAHEEPLTHGLIGLPALGDAQLDLDGLIGGNECRPATTSLAPDGGELPKRQRPGWELPQRDWGDSNIQVVRGLSESWPAADMPALHEQNVSL